MYYNNLFKEYENTRDKIEEVANKWLRFIRHETVGVIKYDIGKRTILIEVYPVIKNLEFNIHVPFKYEEIKLIFVPLIYRHDAGYMRELDKVQKAYGLTGFYTQKEK